MTSWLAAALAVIVVLLAGCTDVQGVETSAGDSQPQADATSEQAGAASEASEAAQSEAADESETPKNAPEGDKRDEASERPRPRRPAAVGPDDRGADVRTLQKRLDELGFAPGPVDGVYGPRTTAAVEAFQLLSDLEQGGRANAATLAALEDFESDAPIIEAGDKGKAVKRLQQRLADGPFDPGPDD